MIVLWLPLFDRLHPVALPSLHCKFCFIEYVVYSVAARPMGLVGLSPTNDS